MCFFCIVFSFQTPYSIHIMNHRYEAAYASRLPESVCGKEFVQKYGDHDDSVTKIDESLSYAVHAPTRHPIYENFRVKVYK